MQQFNNSSGQTVNCHGYFIRK